MAHQPIPSSIKHFTYPGQEAPSSFSEVPTCLVPPRPRDDATPPSTSIGGANASRVAMGPVNLTPVNRPRPPQKQNDTSVSDPSSSGRTIHRCERPSRGFGHTQDRSPRTKIIMPGAVPASSPMHPTPRSTPGSRLLAAFLEICRLLDATCFCNLRGYLVIGQVVTYIAQVRAAIASLETDTVPATLHTRDGCLACEHENAAARSVAIEAAPLDVDEGADEIRPLALSRLAVQLIKLT